MIKDDREIVSAIRARLADRVGKDRYEVWFGAGTQLSVRGEKLVVSVPNQFFQDWLRSHFRRELEASSLDAFGKPLSLEFRISATMVASAPQAEVLSSAVAQQFERNIQRTIVGIAASQSAASSEPAPRGRFAGLDTFVVGNSNCLAHKAAQMAADQPGTYSPLLIHGPTSTGKTHLLEGIYSAFKKSHPREGAVYLSAEQFTSHFLEALHGSGLPSFRRKYRGLSLLIIDDVHFFAGKRATLVELLHTIETLLRAGRQLVFAADRSPSALKALGSELIARLSGGMTCRLESAEYPTRLGIVRQHALRLGLMVPQEVEAYVASHFTEQSRELAGAIKRLQATSMAHGRPITLALAEEALSDLIDHQGRVVKLADIEKAVCDVLGLDRESLQSNRKTKTISHPRMLAMWLARKHTRAALSEIGCYFGHRSHSTVISAQKKIESWMAKGCALQLNDRAWSLEETIRRVEENLRAG
ncbi:MAG: chromosomal replication initiator protein DnaA [Planctomycetia bacterium]|nr:chromosomal replication initiator protein DnaA [Planctomycetia bacterium]